VSVIVRRVDNIGGVFVLCSYIYVCEQLTGVVKKTPLTSKIILYIVEHKSFVTLYIDINNK